MSSRADVEAPFSELMTRRFSWRSSAFGTLCCLMIASFSLTGSAQPDPSAAHAPAAIRDFPKRLTITVVADERLLGTFQQRVSSWFSDGTEVSVAVTSGVDEQGLLASSPSEVKAWIVPLSEQRALLTFSSVNPPAAPRHLVREVRLRDGFDELGLERLASVTHSAFVALSEGVEGVEREQAERELGAAGVATATQTPSQPASAPLAPPVAPTPKPTRDVSAIVRTPTGATNAPRSLLIAAGYGLRFRGAEGVGHGPSLTLGVQLQKGSTAFDLQLFGLYLFRSEFEAKPFSASVQTTALRAQVGVEPRLRASLAGQALLGLGVDLAQISSSAANSSSEGAALLPYASGTQWRGAGELTLGILWRGALLDLGMYAHASFMFEDVRYTAQTNDGEALLARPWRIQPALSLQGRFRAAL